MTLTTELRASAPREAPPNDAETISGGHLVAKALKAEGIDVIFTLCGGHIIDIYDGCIDEGIKVSTFATSRSRRTPPTAMRA